MSSTLILSLALTLLGQETSASNELQTIAERSDYQATARSEEVAAFGQALAKVSKQVHVTSLGTSAEGRPIPLWVVADPPINSAEAARRSGKLIVLLLGNIHGGEVCGKEALPALVRSLVEKPGHPLLRDLILAVVPNLNPDGNDRIDKAHRPEQAGPDSGVGQRGNAAGLDLNRDFIKLDAPETRALLRFVRGWDPHLVIDTHTTNGSHHRFLITYEGPKNPAGDPRVVDYTRGQLLPRVGSAFTRATGHPAYFYGILDPEHTKWTTYPAYPRFGTSYFGLRGRIAILSEAYAYAPYRSRVEATRDFVHACLDDVAAHKDEIRRLLAEVRDEAVKEDAGGRAVAIRAEARAFPEKATILGFVETEREGKRVPTNEPKEYTVERVQKFEPTMSVARPFAYLIPEAYSSVVENLQRHGIQVDVLREDLKLAVEVYRVERLDRASETYEGHSLVSVSVSPRSEERSIPVGTYVVRTTQALGSLAAYLLEPSADDSLTRWNYFDSGLTVGADFPVARLLSNMPLLTAAARPLAEERTLNQPVTFESLRASRGRGGFLGLSSPPPIWLDATSWLQVKNGKLCKVDARTGRATLFIEASKMAEALKSIPGLKEEVARRWSEHSSFTMNPTHQAALLEHEGDLYIARFDGALAFRLTQSGGEKQVTTFSPDGKFVAFVRDQDLYVVDLATRTERRLTLGGGNRLRRGLADWVYGEEIFNRNDRAYWWSPDSAWIAFLEFDDRPVPAHTVVNDAQGERRVEPTPYPRSGEPNPHVRLGLVPVTGGDVKWTDLSNYDRDKMLISNVSWRPDSRAAIAYVQDRAQTWLDVVSVPVDGGTPRKLFRETTRAWVESTGAPRFLDDGSFLFLSERDGWKHLYHYASDGTLKRRITEGPWEVREILHVDPKQMTVLVTTTRDQPMSVNIDRVTLASGSIEALTQGRGSHRAVVNPDGELFFEAASERTRPSRATLRNAKGEPLRTVDSNPVYRLEELRLAPRERLTIPARDGFPLEVEVITPVDLDPSKRYPVWILTYAGPHMPMLEDRWMGGDLDGQALASEGIVVVHADPRSASGKGAVSAWSAYKQLGVQELKDLEDVANSIIKSRKYVDPNRIGIEGHSYGGYMTSYALTHSDRFAAGIAGAPVTDWHDYDSIYTERYMGLPAENAEGYERSSVVKAAKNLRGRLLLVHGAIDDNVSVRNTMRLVQALQAAEKEFELMVYPGSRHGGFGAHFNKLRVDFIRRALGGPRGPTP